MKNVKLWLEWHRCQDDLEDGVRQRNKMCRFQIDGEEMNQRDKSPAFLPRRQTGICIELEVSSPSMSSPNRWCVYPPGRGRCLSVPTWIPARCLRWSVRSPGPGRIEFLGILAGPPQKPLTPRGQATRSVAATSRPGGRHRLLVTSHEPLASLRHLSFSAGAQPQLVVDQTTKRIDRFRQTGSCCL